METSVRLWPLVTPARWSQIRSESDPESEVVNTYMSGKKIVNPEFSRQIRMPAFLLWLVILIFAFGCEPASTSSASVISTMTFAPPTIEPTETPIPTPTPSVTFTAPAPKGLIKIFSQSPLSGDLAFFGTDILRGVQLAVLQLGGPLSEQGYRAGLVPYDDRNIYETALKNARKIAADPDILCGIGHYDSTITTRTSVIYHQAGLALVAPSDTDPLLTDRWYLEINRVIGRIDGQGKAGAWFAKELGFSSVYIISSNDDNGRKNAEYFRREADRLEIQVMGMVITNMTDANVRSIVGRLIDAKPELVYISNAADKAIPFIQQARAAGFEGAFLGTEALNNPSLFSITDSSLVAGGGLYFTITSPPANYYPDAARFVQDFKARYDASPLLFAARAYDAAGICLKAIEEASKAAGGEIPTRAQVVRAIRALTDYKGITGTYTFNLQGDPTLAPYYVYKVVSVEAANWSKNFIIAAYEVPPP